MDMSATTPLAGFDNSRWCNAMTLPAGMSCIPNFPPFTDKPTNTNTSVAGVPMAPGVKVAVTDNPVPLMIDVLRLRGGHGNDEHTSNTTTTSLATNPPYLCTNLPDNVIHHHDAVVAMPVAPGVTAAVTDHPMSPSMGMLRAGGGYVIDKFTDLTNTISTAADPPYLVSNLPGNIIYPCSSKAAFNPTLPSTDTLQQFKDMS